MSLKRLENIENGETAEFLQIFANGEPEIFCKKFGNKDILMESYSFLREILNDLGFRYEFLSEETKVPRLEGKNYSYEGIGRFAKDHNIVKIWKIPGYSYNKRHLSKYSERFLKVKFEKNFIIKEGEG